MLASGGLCFDAKTISRRVIPVYFRFLRRLESANLSSDGKMNFSIHFKRGVKMIRRTKEDKPLQLVKSAADNPKKTGTARRKTTPPDTDATDYYKHVEQYAQKIRGTDDVSEIIGILDTVLGETRDLRHNNEVYSAQEQVRLAERKIETLKLELEQLRELVHTDPMTGVFNRRGLDAVYLREAARADRNENILCAVVIDLDHFKHVNDTHGHQFGDEVLIQFARITKQTLRPSDVVARFGGEEFVILLPDTPIESAVWVMQRLQNNFSKADFRTTSGDSVSITFSGGLAVRRLQENQNPLVKRADEALYQAKTSGRNRVIVAADSQ
ncbi:MAG: GGDEF domain-containing protein [Nitrosomonas sp.]|nr:GGDEF domain-containing protein [Nitrosomonas sp.]